MKVQLSGSARTYFQQEAAYLRQRNRSAAQAFRNRISQALETLAHFPQAGFSHDGLPISGISRLIVGDYLLDYQMDQERILIISIRHGRQSTPNIPAKEDFGYEAPDDAS